MSTLAASGSLLARSLDQSRHPAVLRLAAVAMGLAATAAAAQVSIPLPFTPVPLTLQPMVVLLAGAALGSRLGAAAMALYLLAGVAGLPVFAFSATLPPGAGRLLGPTGGYLMAYPLAAFVTGRLAERGWDRRYLTSVLAMMAGLLVIYAGGLSWLLVTLAGSADAAVTLGAAPFLAADLLKIAVAAWILPKTWTLVGARDEQLTTNN